MRISDWSSDVCSSDLRKSGVPLKRADRGLGARPRHAVERGFVVATDRQFPLHVEHQAAAVLRRGSRRRSAPRRFRGTLLRREFQMIQEFLRWPAVDAQLGRSEEHTSELQSLMRISYAGFCLKKKKI